MKIEIRRGYETGYGEFHWVYCNDKGKIRILYTDGKFYSETETMQYMFKTRREAEVVIATAMILGVL